MYLEVATALLIILNINTFSAGIIRHWQPIKNMRIEKGKKKQKHYKNTLLFLYSTPAENAEIRQISHLFLSYHKQATNL